MRGTPVVLCLSSEPLLLRLRTRVIATQYEALPATGFEDLRRLAAGGAAVDAAVLCHTFSREVCTQLVREVRRQWPDCSVLLITAADTGCGERVDAQVGALEGPKHLLRAIASLLAAKSAGLDTAQER